MCFLSKISDLQLFEIRSIDGGWIRTDGKGSFVLKIKEFRQMFCDE